MAKNILTYLIIFSGIFLAASQAQAALPGDVVINEIMWMGSNASDTDEWIELRNASNTAIDLNGWQLERVFPGATTTLTINTASGASTTTIGAGGYYLIANATSASSNILNSVTVQLATTTINLIDNYSLNGPIILKNNVGTVIDQTPASSTTAWPAGALGAATSSMARNYTPGAGTTTTNWHTSIIATNWDAGTPEKGTPGANNGFSVAGATSQLNADASGTIYVLAQIHGTSPATATASFTSLGNYQMHLFPALYDFLAFRDINGSFAYNDTSEPVKSLTNSGVGYTLATTGLANIDFAMVIAPSITSLSTSSVNIGNTVVISGIYFGDSTTTAQGSVLIPNSNISAGNYITSWSSTSISVQIPPATTPPGPQTGFLYVTVGGVQASSTTLTIKPKISSVAATAKSITVNFDSYMDGMGGADSISNYTLQSPIGTIIGLVSAWTEFRGNKIYITGVNLTVGNTFRVAANTSVKSMAGTAVDTNFNSATNTVVAGPSITSVTPNSSTTGAVVTIAGTGFTATGTLYFSPGMPTPGSPMSQPVQAVSTAWSNTSITATVPAGAKSGPLFVVTGGGVESDFSQNAFFDVLGNANFKIFEKNTNNIISSSSARIVIGAMGGPKLYYTGDSNGTSYTSGTTTVPAISSMGWAWAFDNSGAHITGRGQQLNTGTTTTFTLATSLTKISGLITGAATNRNLVVWSNPVSGSGDNMQWAEPIFVITNANGTTSYAIGLAATGTYMIGVEDPGFGSSASSSPKIAPSAVSVNASSTSVTSTANFAFVAATARIRGKIEKAGGTGFDVGPGMESFHVWAYQPVENGLHASAMPDSNGFFDLYVNPAIYIIGVGGPDLPFPVEQQIEVKTGDTNYGLTNTTVDVTMIIKAPEEYIAGRITDSSGNAISGASIFAWNTSGPGGGQAFADNSGYYKLYVNPGTYTVEGFAPNYGKLTTKSGVIVSDNCHTGSTCPSVDFAVSSEFATISGTVTKNSSLSSDIEVWVTAGATGYGINRTRTDSSGAFSLQVPYSSGYWIHAAQPGAGEIYQASLPTFSSTRTTTTVAIAVNTASINVRISPATAFSEAFIEARNSATTSQRGFSNSDVATSSSFRQYTLTVPRPSNLETWTYNIYGGIPGYGPLTPTSTAISSSTLSANIWINLGNIYTVHGTIEDPDASSAGNQAEGAFIWAANSSGQGGGIANASGTFSFPLKQGIYDFGVDKNNYTGNMLSNQAITADATITGLTLSSANITITGTTTISGTAESGAWVWATNGAGGWAGDETDGNGTYILKVTSGTWQVQAVSEGYQGARQSVSATSGTTTLNFALTAISGYTSATPTMSSIVPSTGGTVTGDNVTVDAPAGALSGSDSNTGRVSIQKTTSIPQTNGVKPLGSAAYEITATNASGTPFTTLVSDITITLTYSAADLAAAGISQASSSQLSLGYWDSTANTWTTISTNAATNSDGGVTYTGNTQHLSPYAPLVSSGSSPPDTPTNFTATKGNQLANLSWTASAGATKYYIYQKSGSLYPYLAQTTGTTYTVAGLTNGTTYYYKLSALNADDDESTATEAVSATPADDPGPSAGSSYIYNPTPASAPAMPITTSGQVTVTASAGGKTTVTSAENTTASALLPASVVSADTIVTIAPVAKTASVLTTAIASAPADRTMVGGYVYNYTATAGGTSITNFSQSVTLTLSYTDTQITGLKESTLKAYYWSGSASAWVSMTTTVNAASNTLTVPTTHFTYFAIFGETETATTTVPVAETTPSKPISQMTAWELKAEIVRIMALILQLQAQLKEMLAESTVQGIPAGFTFKTTLKSGMISDDVKYLQILLNSDQDTMVAESGPGSSGQETKKFGYFTKGSIVRFQEKYAASILIPVGLTQGTGIVGSGTRAKLNALLGR